jgi:hypothetical protein
MVDTSQPKGAMHLYIQIVEIHKPKQLLQPKGTTKWQDVSDSNDESEH